MNCEPWPLVPTCLPAGWSVNPEVWTPEQRTAVRIATSMLRRATAGVYGLCVTTLRPCRTRKCSDRYPYMGVPLSSSPWTPVLHDGKLYNITCGCADASTCGCGPICEVPLDGPVYDVLSVKVDGVPVDNTTYWVDDYNKLVRRKGSPCWPECQDLELPDTEPGTFSVTYRRGALPDADGELALTLLAVEVAKLCSGDKSCALPRGTTRVSREGIDIEIEIPAGKTGIRLVDNWIDTVNPFSAWAPMRVYSPDTVRGRTRTAPSPGDVDPPSPGSGSFVYQQTTPAAVWEITHPLGFYPGGVQVLDSAGQEVVGLVTYPAVNVVRIEFSAPVSGVAYLS
jgi:hypothetical protein